MINIDLRPLGEVENSILSDIRKQDYQFFPDPWSEQSWKDAGQFKEYYLAWVYQERKILGWALLKLSSLEGLVHLLKILVVPEARGHGNATVILNAIKAWSVTRTVNRCYLEVDKSNSTAVAFYGCQGFKILHEIKAFYSDGRDALIMELNY